ncbi:MAG: MBL fold hydrolase, partial [Chloroflexi bacterium RBG_16_58_8]
MKPGQLKTDIYTVGAVDWDRRLFDALIPLPDGTSYNSYLIRAGETNVLVDTVDLTMQAVLFNNLEQLDIRRIDYIISHHAEQDHSGTIPAVLARYPGAKVVCTPRCQELLTAHLPIPNERFKTVADKETISIGGRTLEFIYTPWVHWPETMCTYLREEKILFSCDFFGSHLAASDTFVTDEGRVYEAALRYYAEIMMPFRKNIQSNLEKLKGYSIDIIAPSHGPAYHRPDFILNAYRRWIDDKPGNIAVVPYVSMHGSTKIMVAYFVQALSRRGVTVNQFDL